MIQLTNCSTINYKNLDIKFSPHDALLEQFSSGTFKVERYESLELLSSGLKSKGRKAWNNFH